MLPRLQSLYKNILDSKDVKTDTETITLSASQMSIADGSVNVVSFLAQDSLSQRSPIAHNAALKNLELAIVELKRNDFAVIDVIIDNKIARDLAAALLTSTVWFDRTNGHTFAAHPDDGLVFSFFERFSREICASMSGHVKYRVSRFYVQAADLSSSSVGPLSVGSDKEIAVVVWLNPANPAADLDSSSDGLVLYDRYTADRLFANGVARYPNVHPEFLSSKGSLNVNVTRRYPNAAVEVIPRVYNRMVLIAPGRPFEIITPGRFSNERFQTKTSLVLVMVVAGGDP